MWKHSRPLKGTIWQSWSGQGRMTCKWSRQQLYFSCLNSCLVITDQSTAFIVGSLTFCMLLWYTSNKSNKLCENTKIVIFTWCVENHSVLSLLTWKVIIAHRKVIDWSYWGRGRGRVLFGLKSSKRKTNPSPVFLIHLFLVK